MKERTPVTRALEKLGYVGMQLTPTRHPRESGDPEVPAKHNTVIPNLFRDLLDYEMLKQVQHDTFFIYSLDPRFRGDDDRGIARVNCIAALGYLYTIQPLSHRSPINFLLNQRILITLSLRRKR